jgi:hypothetical protein
MNNLIDFLICLNDSNKAKALYVNPKDFSDFVVDFVLNTGLQNTQNRVMVMSLDELSFLFSDQESRSIEVTHFVKTELSSLVNQ